MGEKYTADSQEWKKNPYLPAVVINQIETAQYFHVFTAPSCFIFSPVLLAFSFFDFFFYFRERLFHYETG